MSSAPKAALRPIPVLADTELVALCLKGREEAWSALIDRYKNLIYSVPTKYGFGQEDAGDIFQSVCLDLLCELPKLREPKALPGWLARVAYHKCFHWKNEQRRYQPHSEDIDPMADSDEIPENLLQEFQQAQIVREAIRGLKPRCQIMVHRLFYENPAPTYESLAAGLGLAVGSIGFVRRRCLEKLRIELEKAGRNE